ncbi:hypothetical protein [Chryseobacterium sp.]|uniref:hypothetical protein n=1 Tax=Chryseobacterium sp. TaxID=1871047 RepID=UPI00289643E5|nr:hypothetical protein [Chryseobacterium sp.]
MKNIFRLCSLLLVLSSIVINAQTDPDLEIGPTSGDFTTQGPTDTFTLNFLRNTNNPGGAPLMFDTAPNPLSVEFKITNNQITNTISGALSTRNVDFGVYYGAINPRGQRLAVGAANDNYPGTALSTLFTYAGYATAGTGIYTPQGSGSGSQIQNFAVSTFITTNMLAKTGILSNSTVYMADIEINFSRPVNNPVLHFVGLGSNLSLMGASPIYELNPTLSSPSSGISLSRLSGSNNFSISGLQIANSDALANSNYQAAGSVLVTGKGITKLVFKIYIKGNGDNDAAHSPSGWGDPTLLDTGDQQNISISVQESDLAITKTIDKPNTHVGDTVVFTLTATNNGMSDSPTVVNDLLPPGYTYVNHTASQGTYDSSTGVWNAGIVGGNSASAHPQSVTLNITATVNATTPHSNHTNTATVTGDNLDLVTNNDTASVTPNVIDAVNDTFSIPASGGTSGSILNNDTYNGSGASAANPTITVITPASGTGSLPTLNTTTGIVTVPAGTTPGTYTITYQICKTSSSGTACDQAVITINVTGAGCYNPVTNLNSGLDTKHGITLLKRAESGNGNWPGIRNSAYTVLESNSKGFVITRMTSDPAQTSAANYISNDANSKITNPQEGMMVYDTYAKCLKIYDGTQWSCFSTPSCP